MSEVAPHEARLLIERFELFKRELDLQTFITQNPFFQKLESEDQALMEEQLVLMTKYRTILERRIAKINR